MIRMPDGVTNPGPDVCPPSKSAAEAAIRCSSLAMLFMACWLVLDVRSTLDAVPRRAWFESAELRLDPSSASAGELELIPGIGPATAARIVEHRRIHGVESLQFWSNEGGWRWTLDAVPGVGPVTARRAAPHLVHPAVQRPRRESAPRP